MASFQAAFDIESDAVSKQQAMADIQYEQELNAESDMDTLSMMNASMAAAMPGISQIKQPSAGALPSPAQPRITRQMFNTSLAEHCRSIVD